MLTLHHNLPASIATKPDVKCVRFSPNDTPEVLKESVFTTVGSILHSSLRCVSPARIHLFPWVRSKAYQTSRTLTQS